MAEVIIVVFVGCDTVQSGINLSIFEERNVKCYTGLICLNISEIQFALLYFDVTVLRFLSPALPSLVMLLT
jgi:hypothetical protein